MNETKTLGEVIREMVKMALKSEDKTFRAPLEHITELVLGKDCRDEFGALLKLEQLKSSYVYNTTARMEELREAGLKATHSIESVDYMNDFGTGYIKGDPELVITLKPGTTNIGTRKKAVEQTKSVAIEEFKSKLLKFSPSTIELEGEMLEGALYAINAYREMIKEMK